MYDEIAYYYDLTHADLTADIPFILNLAHGSQGRILELGCGTGRLVLPLARAGYRVTGVDNAKAMLARARQHLAAEVEEVKERVTLIESDMAAVDLTTKAYSLAIIPYNTFMHLDSVQALTVLKQVRNCLTQNGRLFIDLINPFLVANTPDDQTLSLENHLVDPTSGDTILHLAANKLHSSDQILHVTWIYDRTPIGGGSVHRTVVKAAYHYRYLHQMEILLQESGFRPESIWGNYDQNTYNEESDRLLLLCS